jgi:hypothetical protein
MANVMKIEPQRAVKPEPQSDVATRVETKIFVSYFRENFTKFFSLFAKKAYVKLQKL